MSCDFGHVGRLDVPAVVGMGEGERGSDAAMIKFP